MVFLPYQECLTEVINPASLLATLLAGNKIRHAYVITAPVPWCYPGCVNMIVVDTFEVFSAVWLSIPFFWGVTQLNWLIGFRRFEGPYCLCLQESVRHTVKGQ